MRTKALLLVLAIAAVGLMPVRSQAQQIPSPYRFWERGQDVGPFVGWMLADRGTADLGPEDGLVLGVQGALKLSGPIQLGIQLGRFSADREVINPRTEGGPTVLGTEDFTLFLLAGRLQLNLTGSRTWHGMTPYVLAGLGLAMDASNEPSCTGVEDDFRCTVLPQDRYDFGSSVLGQVGLGVTWFLTDRLSTRWQLQDNIWQLTSPEGFREEDVELETIPPENEWVNNVMLSLGVSYWF